MLDENIKISILNQINTITRSSRDLDTRLLSINHLMTVFNRLLKAEATLSNTMVDLNNFYRD